MTTGMHPWMRTTFTVLGLVVLAAFAYFPLLRAGFVASDYRVLVEVGGGGAEETDGEASEAVPMPPLSGLSLSTSRWLWGMHDRGPLGLRPALFLRLENLGLLALAAVGLALFTRRLLLPWTGSEHSRAAAFATALVFGLHPLCSSAVAGVAGRGELLGLVLAGWAGALFLRGRQARKIGFTAASFVLCGLGGFASDLILGMPLLLAGAEFLSAHRYRSMRGRLRTTTTTLMVFGAAASLDLILHVSRLGTAALPPGVRALGEISTDADLATQLARAIEKVGLLVLPSNFQVLGLLGTALVGAAFLMAMQPGLLAARSAPRLWSWCLVGWLAALAVTELLHAHVRVAPAELFLARVLLPSVAVMAVGLGIASTALSGNRRRLLPWGVAVAYAVVAHGNAKPWQAAADAAAELRGAMLAALDEHGSDATLLVLDPPDAIAGALPVGEALAWLVHPDLGTRDGEPVERARPEVAGLSRDAFLALVRDAEFPGLLEGGLVVLLPPEPDGEEHVRRSLRLEAGDPSSGPRSWRDDLGSPSINLNPLSTSVLEVTARTGTALDALEEVTWTSVGGAEKRSARAGVWFGESEEPFGLYDMGSSLEWRLGDRIRGVFFEGGASPLSQVEVREELPPLREDLVAELPENRYRIVFAPVTDARVLSNLSRGRFVLGLLDLETYGYAETDVIRDPNGVLRAELGGWGRARRLLDSGGRYGWVLEFRVEDRAVARNRGHVDIHWEW